MANTSFGGLGRYLAMGRWEIATVLLQDEQSDPQVSVASRSVAQGTGTNVGMDGMKDGRDPQSSFPPPYILHGNGKPSMAGTGHEQHSPRKYNGSFTVNIPRRRSEKCLFCKVADNCRPPRYWRSSHCDEDADSHQTICHGRRA